MTFRLTIVLFAFSCSVFGQDCITKTEIKGESTIVYKLCNDVLVDTLYEYDKRGRLASWTDYGTNPSPTDLIKYCSYNLKKLDPLKKTTGFFTADGKKTGEWKYFKKNEVLWDLVVYENDVMHSRVRYDKFGSVLWERKYYSQHQP